MRRGTTPTVTVTVGADITAMHVYLAFKQAGRDIIVKENPDFTMMFEDDATTIACPLAQEDTLAFKPGKCEVQIRATEADGAVALATNIGTVDIGRILLEGRLS